jgi:2-dehydro-3-deoxygluconokinase
MCARLGAPVRLLGRVGGDPLGRRLLIFWRACGIDTSAMVVDTDAPTGLYVVEQHRPDPIDHPFTYWRRGSAGSRWAPADVADMAILSGLAALVVTGVTVSVSDSCEAAVWTLIDRARAHGVPVACMLNHGAGVPTDRELLARLATSADILIASIEDLAHTFPDWSPVEMFDLVQEPQHELVLTDGATGARVSWSEGSVLQPAPKVAVRAGPGAGDALAGAYLWARFQRRQPPAEALAWGVAAASLSSERDGGATAYPTPVAIATARADLPPARAWGAADAVSF